MSSTYKSEAFFGQLPNASSTLFRDFNPESSDESDLPETLTYDVLFSSEGYLAKKQAAEALQSLSDSIMKLASNSTTSYLDSNQVPKLATNFSKLKQNFSNKSDSTVLTVHTKGSNSRMREKY